MSIGSLFWILYVFCIVFGVYIGRGVPAEGRFNFYGSGLILWVLLFLLGWHCFGFVLHE